MNTTTENATAARPSDARTERPPISVPMLDEVDERLSGNDRRLTEHVTDELIARGTEMLVATYHVQMLCDDAAFAESADREKLIALTEASRRMLHEVLVSAISGHVYAIAGEQRREYEARLKLLSLADEDMPPAADTPKPVAWSPLFRLIHDCACPVPVIPVDGENNLRVADGVTFFTAEQAAAAMPGHTVAELTSLWHESMHGWVHAPDGTVVKASADATAINAELAIGEAFAAPPPAVDPFDYPAEVIAQDRANAAAAAAADFPVGRRIFTRERDSGFVVANDGTRVFSWGVFNDGTEPTLMYDEIGKGLELNNTAIDDPDDPDDPGGFEPYAVVDRTLDRLMSHRLAGVFVRNFDGESGTVVMGHTSAILVLVDLRRLELWEKGDVEELVDRPRKDRAVIRALLSLLPVDPAPAPHPATAESATSAADAA